jgi:hypothetical protein
MHYGPLRGKKPSEAVQYESVMTSVLWAIAQDLVMHFGPQHMI